MRVWLSDFLYVNFGYADARMRRLFLGVAAVRDHYDREAYPV